MLYLINLLIDQINLKIFIFEKRKNLFEITEFNKDKFKYS